MGLLADIRDLVLTPAEALFIKWRMYGVARRLIDCHYPDPTFRPWARELALAEICEGMGQLPEAEEHYRRVIRRNNPFGHLMLGEFYHRTGRRPEALNAFEAARALSLDDPALETRLEQRIRTLRSEL